MVSIEFYLSLSVFKNAMMAAISESLRAGPASAGRFNGAFVTSMFLRYFAGKSLLSALPYQNCGLLLRVL